MYGSLLTAQKVTGLNPVEVTKKAPTKLELFLS
nr:MAG TPA: hypothetical protein [Caudoviricetes sp.]